jgi:hypothetical protein
VSVSKSSADTSQTARGEGWTGRWIWTRGKPRRPVQFSYFRKSFLVERDVPDATICCTADSKYRLWVNGEYVGCGPARGHPDHPYYDAHVVPLRKGRNTLAFLVAHYTEGQRFFASVEPGLWCQVEAGGRVLAATDGTWKALSSTAHGTLPGLLLFPERFDARQEPADWQRPEFDDRAWPAAIERAQTKLAPPSAFRPRPIPLLTETRLAPARILGAGVCHDDALKDWEDGSEIAPSLQRMTLTPATGGELQPALRPPCAWPSRPITMRLGAGKAGYVILDFGRETLANPEFRVRGAAGILMDIGYSECLWNNHVATLWQEAQLRQSERIILRQGLTCHRMHQPRGFRYMVVRLANPAKSAATVSLESVVAYEEIYPTQPRGSFTCSDELLNRIFSLSARTVNLCMEDAYTDCPWRERSQWVGDAQPETLFSYYCFGAYDLARKAVIEFTSGNTAEGWIPSVFPTSVPFNLPTWGMRVPVIAWEYYLYSGDKEVLRSAHEGVKKQMQWFSRYENKDGLVVGMSGWKFVDWTCVDADLHTDGAVQGWYLEALECSAKLALAAGDKAAVSDYRKRAARLRKSLARLYWSPERRAFRKYRPGSPDAPPGAMPELLGQHENFLFALLGVGTSAQRSQALDAMRGATGRYLPNLGDYQSAYLENHKGNYLGDDCIRLGTPFWSYYALLALMEAGRVREALEYIRLCWGLMLEFGATSCWEMWDRHTSLCHGWSAAPAMVLPAYVLGVKPLTPGFRTFEMRPRLGDLEWAEGRVPTPTGTIHSAWHKSGAVWRGSAHVPQGMKGILSWDAATNGRPARVEVDGCRVNAASRIPLAAGKHNVVVRLRP